MRCFKILLGSIMMLQVSNAQNLTGSCAADSALLNAQPEVSAATTVFQGESIASLQDFMKNCNLFERRCTKDLSSLPSANNLTEVCVAEGGQIVYQDARLKCDGSVNGVPIPGGFKVAAERFPACLGSSCDPDSLPSEVSAVFSTVTDVAKVEIQKVLGDSITCEDSAGLSIAVHSTLIVLTSLFVSWMSS